jgi:hypothetical protein
VWRDDRQAGSPYILILVLISSWKPAYARLGSQQMGSRNRPSTNTPAVPRRRRRDYCVGNWSDAPGLKLVMGEGVIPTTPVVRLTADETDSRGAVRSFPVRPWLALLFETEVDRTVSQRRAEK